MVELVGIQCLVGNDVVLQQRFEVCLAMGAEEEGKHFRPEKLEGMVIWREESRACGMSFRDIIRKSGFDEGKLKGGELAWKVRYNG